MAEGEEHTTASGARCTIRATKDAADCQELWWSHMLELGWNRSYYDLASYIASTRSRGFLLVYPEDSSKPQGHVMATIFDNSTAWIAMFITAPSIRKSGYGRPLFAAALADISEHKVTYTGLDAVAEQIATYERRGFVAGPKSRAKCMVRPFLVKAPWPSSTVAVPEGLEVKDCKDLDFASLVENERRVAGFERALLWTEEYFRRPDVKSVALVDAGKKGADKLVAWLVVRRCPGGARIGPVYAPDEGTAEVLLAKAMELATVQSVKEVPMPGVQLSELSDAEIAMQATVIVEVWAGNESAVGFFEKLGWVDAGVDYHRMWLNGKVPPQQSEGGMSTREMWAIYDAAIG